MISFALQKKLHAVTGAMQLDVQCKIEHRQFVSLYGASGAGKTSVLRMLAGFMQPDNGWIKMNNDVWFDADKRIDLTPQRRKIGFVFQDYALFPNMNVRENISFALNKRDDKQIVYELMELTGLRHLAERKIETLSGGQKQRVALSRALAKRPALLLLDEPLSAIDNDMRQQLQVTLLEVHKRFHLTTILVSHDMDEIIKLADTIIYLEHGSIRQCTTPAAFFFDGHAQNLSGNVLYVEGDYIVVLMSNRIMKVMAPKQDINFEAGEKIELFYDDAVPVIRKL